jgi:hypothetical protein
VVTTSTISRLALLASACVRISAAAPWRSSGSSEARNTAAATSKPIASAAVQAEPGTSR